MNNPYAEGIAATMAAFGRNRARHSSAEFIAEGVYGAATDGSRQMRYVLGEDAKAMFAGRSAMTDEQYVAYIENWMKG